MVENIIQKIELYNSIREEIEKKIREISKAESNAKSGYNGWCSVEDYVKLYLDGDNVVIESTHGNEDDGSCTEHEQANKDLFSLTEEQLIAKFNEQYKDVIIGRERMKQESERKAGQLKEEHDRREFKRLNEKFRGKKIGKK